MKIVILTQEKYKDIAWDLYLLLKKEDTNVEEDTNVKEDANVLPEIIFDHDFFDLGNWDIAISLLYNKIIKNNEFDLPRLGTINIHPSILPFHRGSCPNFWAMLVGDGAGWTAHRMTAEIDRGDIYLQQPVRVYLNDTAETLQMRLFEELPTFLSKLAEKLVESDLQPLDIAQDNEQVHTLAEFHELHDLKARMLELSPEAAYYVYAILNLIQGCSYTGHQPAYFDTPDGRVEFWARKVE
jgi:methionyl-tRNA formyltransferase